LFRFEHPYWLAALILAPVMVMLFVNAQRIRKQKLALLGDPDLVKALTGSFSPTRHIRKFILVLIALVCLVLSIANPQFKGASLDQSRQGLDVMLIMDVSKSMLAQDIKPNRLERSRQLMSLLIDQLSNNRLGMIWFAGRAYLQMPLTTDLSAAKLFLQNAGPAAVPTQGTVIGEALKLAGSSFNTKEQKYKAVILISDGEDHDPEALEVVERLVESGVMINTVGVGSLAGTTIIDPETGDTKKDANGNVVISKLNEEQLRNLAVKGNGTYVYLQDPASATQTLLAQLNGIEKKQLESSDTVQYNSFFYVLLLLALLLLITELVISERKTILQ
jgi:Ca-activated chloride channel family protein